MPAPVAEALRRANLPASAVSVVIQPVDQSAPLLTHNADAAMNPASVMKLVISAAALDTLGPAATWKTRVYALQSPDAQGVLRSDLYLQGGGDPKLTLERLWLLLHELRERGVREIRGDVIVDRSFFTNISGDTGAFDNEPLKPQNTLPDALLLNYNSVRFDFLLAPGVVRTTLRIVAMPEIPLNIINRVRVTHANGCGDWREAITVDYAPQAVPPQITFTGNYPESCGDKPWYFSLHARHDEFLRAAFEQIWSEVGGRWTPTSPARLHEGALPEQAVPLLEFESPPLADVLRDINKFSNNVMARNLFLTLGKGEDTQPATLAQAAQRVGDWLKGIGINAPELVLENGSGLSRAERISARHLAAVLQYAWRSPWMPEYISSLSLFGVDGTTRRRYHDNHAAGQAHLKTGSLNDARALAGFVRAQSGKRFILVWLVNDTRAREALPAQEALLDWLYQQ
ncbi:MAG: D-alanyl-D-alanine carboxypeptidase/D-alanyl-D-alanine-endopeptidase [Burkholderiaceae bacterium]|nr:MAG: D-alanyl-D-alanine carboxypeptidase/D-alanyl-D-alanine-endopeptidase [Burkholderiaceae bacterium]